MTTLRLLLWLRWRNELYIAALDFLVEFGLIHMLGGYESLVIVDKLSVRDIQLGVVDVGGRWAGVLVVIAKSLVEEGGRAAGISVHCALFTEFDGGLSEEDDIMIAPYDYDCSL